MFEQICDTPLWISNQTWNTPTPHLSSCMIDTVFTWLPVKFIWLCIPYIIWECRKSDKQSIQWNYYNISRLLIASLSAVLALVDCILCLLRRFQWHDNTTDTNINTAHIISTVIQCVTRLAVCIIFSCHRKYGLNSCGWHIKTYLLLTTIFGALSIVTYTTQQAMIENYEFIIYCLQFYLTLALLIFSSIDDRLPENSYGSLVNDTKCPQDMATWPSILTFNWMNSLIIKYWQQNSLTIGDLWAIREQNIYALYSANISVLGQRMTACLISAVYRKSLVLDYNDRKNHVTSGQIISLMSIDCTRFTDGMLNIAFAISSPAQILVILGLLYSELGASPTLASAAIICLMLAICLSTSKSVKHYITKQIKYKDQRIQLTNDLLNGIKVTKLYAWETAFYKMIVKLRANEIRHIRWSSMLGVIYVFMATCSPYIVFSVAFIAYIFIDDGSGGQLDAQKLFVSMALCLFLRNVLFYLPTGIDAVLSINITIRRLNKFLNLRDKCDYVTHNAGGNDNCVVSIENGSFTWSAVNNKDKSSNQSNNMSTNKFHLNDINLKITDQSFVAIVGGVGSGKSSLLEALFGEMDKQSGNVDIRLGNKLAYVPQQAWIQNASLKQNILFGKPYSDSLYRQVLYSCSLEQDLSQLTAGDETEIGEKGINLSGGQKQRVSLARAVYSDADLYLMDDPLSAVDAHVGKHLMKEILDSKTGLLRNKTRILVTNQLFVLPNVDQIVVLKNVNETKHEINSLNKFYSNNNNKQLIDEEYFENGNVSYKVYIKYAKQMSILLSTVMFAFVLASNVFIISINFWLKHWSQQQHTGAQQPDNNNYYELKVLTVLTVCQMITLFISRYTLIIGSLRASIRMHNRMLWSVMRSSMQFFDTTPLGRIVNRFSKDIDIIDTTTHLFLGYCLFLTLTCISSVIIISIVTPLFIIPLIILCLLYYMFQHYYTKLSCQLKRLESITRSPIYACFSESIAGLSSIRAYGCEDRFIRQLDRKVDTNMRCLFPFVAANSWLQIRLDLLSNLVVFFAALFIILDRQSLKAGDTGMSLSNVMTLTYTLGAVVRMFVQFENSMVSFERIDEYCRLAPEARWRSANNKKQQLADNWPNRGEIDFVEYSTQYRESLDLVLNSIDLSIKSGEKIGIVGRTGAGKSSLTLALFRLIESVSGRIVIDGIDISQLGLQELRSRLTIIPQDPVLFSGTIRSNLDPFGNCSDDQLWTVLEQSHLKLFVRSLEAGLDCCVAEGGDNLSVGQRQLICLARALLRHTAVLILDEATAAVDVETDTLIQQTIKQQFKSCTVLTIAHRLNTIMDSDRVIVLHEGRVAELDTPNNLLTDSQSIFYSLAKDAGLV
ncbi:multidrug resistance-associated protein 1-like [Oppia nitens]|uniref:multidrug resistance-associated protein 1-like n=1 Tax=Oppia nitens TaxID=1686743 RepID=UPI0023DB540C|nr:multidrug resistance-associated protein 1-like [Oppia nitens]